MLLVDGPSPAMPAKAPPTRGPQGKMMAGLISKLLTPELLPNLRVAGGGVGAEFQVWEEGDAE